TITIKGKLLKSCENPSPLVGHALVLTYSYNVNGKEDVIQSVTNSNEGEKRTVNLGAQEIYLTNLKSENTKFK
ncbi:MAG: hypothetical protein Q8R57_03885, partial [Bacteroidota bacterium]|nr:hypothetical protein [Bacteroidota bacterium]